MAIADLFGSGEALSLIEGVSIAGAVGGTTKEARTLPHRDEGQCN